MTNFHIPLKSMIRAAVHLKTVHIAGILLAAALTLSADVFSFTGTFGSDDDVLLFEVSVLRDSVVTFETLSYAGGINSEGTTIVPGGFDTRLTWFQADGTNTGFDNGGHSCAHPWLGACNDAQFSGTLSAGSYILALTQDGNDSNGGLGDGFGEQGAGNFTASGACSQFCDSLSGTQLTGNWAVDILTVDAASEESAVPEPTTVALTGLILMILMALATRRRLLNHEAELRKE
jgi:hypothetical protein